MERSLVASISEVRDVSSSPDSLRPESVESNTSSDLDVTPIQHGHTHPNGTMAEISIAVTDVDKTVPEVSTPGAQSSEVLTLRGQTSLETDVSMMSTSEDVSRHDLEPERNLNLANGDVPDMAGKQLQNGVDHTPSPAPVVEDLEVDSSSIMATPPQWTFPPVLEDFDLMESDIDPSQLEDVFSDDR